MSPAGPLQAVRRWRPRWYRMVVLSLLVGVATGLGVAAFDWLTRDVSLQRIEKLPTGWLVVMPGIGLAFAAIAVGSPGTELEFAL